MIEPLDVFVPTRVPPRHEPRSAAAEIAALARPGPRRGSLPLQLVLVDGVAIAASTVAAGLVEQVVLGHPPQANAAASAIVLVSFLAALALSGSYRGRSRGFATALVDGSGLAHGLPLGVVLALLGVRTPILIDATDLQVEQVTLVALLGLVAIPATRYLRLSVVAPRRPRRVLIMGSGRMAASVAARLRRCSHVSVVGMVDDDPAEPSGVIGTYAELRELCARFGVDDVVVAFSREPAHVTLEFLRGLDDRVSIWVVPRLYELLSWRSEVAELDGVPLLDVAPAQAGRAARATKRVLDVVVAGALLVLFAPLFAAVAIAIRLTSPGPAIFRQLRWGQNRRPFRIYKFRTMHLDAEQQQAALAERNEVDGPIFKMRDDPRVTRVGRFLRQTSLDELPQLLNVLRGEMSLVGPRPFPVEESQKITGWAAIRFSVPPGMTGLWQVCGRNALSFDDLRHLDYVYTASWSFLWDLRILLQTPASVLHRRGVL